MTKQVTVTFDEWVMNEMIGNAKNRSARIQELVIKGYMAEQRKEVDLLNPSYAEGFKKYFEMMKNVAKGILTPRMEAIAKAYA